MEEIVFQFSLARHRKIKHILGFFLRQGISISPKELKKNRMNEKWKKAKAEKRKKKEEL